MISSSFDNIKDTLSDEKQIYKLPDISTHKFDSVLDVLKSSGVEFESLR